MTEQTWTFGIFNERYTMKAADAAAARIAMVLFTCENIPIAVYEPVRECILPREIISRPWGDVHAAVAALKTITKVPA